MSQKSSKFAPANLVTIMKIAIIGAGSVGTNLHHAFELKGIKTELVHARPLTEKGVTGYGLPVTGYGLPVTGVPVADVYIYTVADHVLAEVVSLVHAPKALHLHTSGSMPIEVFGTDKPHAGVLYFLQSFNRVELIDDWSGIPCFIEGHNIDDIAAIYSLAQSLTSRIYEANQHDRERLHIAAVFANNYSNLMYRIAADVLRNTQIPFEALLPLIDRTAAKVHTIRPADAQTGPAQRGDKAVIAHHMEVLSDLRNQNAEFSSEEIAALYRELAALIGKVHNHPTLTKE